MTSKTTNKFLREVRERAVQMVLEHERDHPSRWAAVVSIAAKIGCTGQTLNEWVKKAEVDAGRRSAGYCRSPHRLIASASPNGAVGDSYDNALAETINGLNKAEVIHRRGPWQSFEAVEFTTPEWVYWFNNRRLLEPIGNIPPAEAEQRYNANLDDTAMAA